MELVGLDVGFSADRPSSGVARLTGAGELRIGHTTSSWEDRRRVVGAGPLDVAAIDAPFASAPAQQPRSCERVFSFGGFQRRCKPGLSHIPGTGQQLRAAGWEAAKQLRDLAAERALATPFPRVGPCNIVEAFPNAFLGVCLPTSEYEQMPKLRRGQKFDWLYDRWAGCERFGVLLSDLGLDGGGELQARCRENTQHDQRAGLVCLLTAAAVYVGRYTAIGDERGGYFYLPPWTAWASWAQRELDQQRRRLPSLRVWINGRVLAVDDDLPRTSGGSA